jgi:UTP--glucose-1-phosphate uridylyltransferase
VKRLKKVVVPAAGLGTRLLPATKEQPKEMLPIFVKNKHGEYYLKPFLQIVFEQLYNSGFRDFCFVVGRSKRSIEDHFTCDTSYVQDLSRSNKAQAAKELNGFYDKVNESNIVFVNQPEPKGFGDAVLRARNFTGNEPFLVHAGDDLILSKNNQYMHKLVCAFEKYDADAVFYVQRVPDPRSYGVINGKRLPRDRRVSASSIYRVSKIEEKPRFPSSKLAAIAIYAFSPRIYQALEASHPDAKNEIQLTNAIQYMIDKKHAVYAVELEKGQKRIDIGTPESYWKVLMTVRKQKWQECAVLPPQI